MRSVTVGPAIAVRLSAKLTHDTSLIPISGISIISLVSATSIS